MRGESGGTDQLMASFALPAAEANPTDSPEPVSRGRRIWAAVLRAVGAIALLATAAIGVAAYVFLLRPGAGGLLTLVIGDWYPTVLELAIIGTGLGVIALVTAAMLAPARSTDPRRRWSVAIAAVLITLVAVSLVPTVILGGFQLLQRPSYVMLEGASEGGCRVVVSESSTLLDGSGLVGIVQPGAVVVEWIGEYRANGDPRQRFALGEYTLSWEGRTAELDRPRLSSLPGTPITCDQ